ncbi:hypothetical protein PHAMO_210205 [Magnetospirillum molischianum DSM 120]|uniref:Uncharacterized protein n=1 Tax=Magnetospirillum molischianum DSM 120 TaxID=1150626 RepID=H8FQQ6_MAGML|nr:hypothetical protein PHAMO_210205 [Magnetospirillum molischianum DSM 120]
MWRISKGQTFACSTPGSFFAEGRSRQRDAVAAGQDAHDGLCQHFQIPSGFGAARDEVCDPRKHAPEIADFSADVFLLKRARVSPGLPVDGVDLVAPIDDDDHIFPLAVLSKKPREHPLVDAEIPVVGTDKVNHNVRFSQRDNFLSAIRIPRFAQPACRRQRRWFPSVSDRPWH